MEVKCSKCVFNTQGKTCGARLEKQPDCCLFWERKEADNGKG